MPHVRELLAHKGSHVLTVSPRATVLDAVAIMNEHRIGGLVVTDRGRVIGIFTERDLLHRVVAQRLDPAYTLVQDVMTWDVVTCDPECDVGEVRSLFMHRRIRHLPIVNREGQLLGMVSIGDVNAWMLEGHEATIHHLHEYIYGRV